MPLQKRNRIVAVLKEKWPEYILEIFVIIFSISISFALDEWKETREKNDLEQSYLKSLRNDLSSDIDELGETIAATKTVLRYTDTLLQPHSSVLSDEFRTAIIQVAKRPNFISKDATFSDLKSSGNLQVIKDFGLKNLLFNYYRHYESGRAVETSERETMNSIFAPYLLKRISLKGLSPSGANLENVNISRLKSDVEFINLISVRKLNRTELLESYQESLETCLLIKASLDKEVK